MSEPRRHGAPDDANDPGWLARERLRRWGFPTFIQTAEGLWESARPARGTPWAGSGTVTACHGAVRLWILHAGPVGGPTILYGGRVADRSGLEGFLDEGGARHGKERGPDARAGAG